MKLYHVEEERFRKYGKVLEGYDFTGLFDALKTFPVPESGIAYVASVDILEKCDVATELEKRGFGGCRIQIGYVSGRNRVLNCLEYHKSSEFNIAMNDMILLLGSEADIRKGKFHTECCEAFLVPAGVGVELYGTTLHYAPFHIEEEGYRVVCVLPRGTNAAKPDMESRDTESPMCFGENKWLMAHEEAPEAGQGAYIGLFGKNLQFQDLEWKERKQTR